MGNLLSLNPKIHRLRTDAKEAGRLSDGQGQFNGILGSEHGGWRNQPGLSVLILLNEGS
jgi:hypothetical protein